MDPGKSFESARVTFRPCAPAGLAQLYEHYRKFTFRNDRLGSVGAVSNPETFALPDGGDSVY